MVRCAVGGCTNYQGKRSDKIIKFFCFPNDPSLCRQWVAACGEGHHHQYNYKIARVCSEHFTEQDWKLEHVLLNVADDKKRLKKGTVPTQNLPQNDESQSAAENPLRNDVVDSDIANYEETEVEETSLNFFHAEVGPPLNAIMKRDRAKIRIESSIIHPTTLHNLKIENRKLRLEAKKLMNRVVKAESVVSNMERIFTKSQIKRLQNPTKNCNWNYEDVAQSIALQSASPLMYQLLCKKNYPVPSPSTLRKWTTTLKLRPGIIASSMKVLTDSKYDDADRLCVLSFIEIRLMVSRNSNEPGDRGLRPYRYAQVLMLRGLMSNWKHIVYYNFDCVMPGLIFKDIIRTLREINFIVVAVVSGVGPRKLAVWRELQIDEENPCFEVFEGEKVFYFANVPHLMKRLRNHFLETGFLVDGATINVEPLREMLTVESADLWVSHDLTQEHISPRRIGQHNLQIASQLFSRSAAEAIRKCIALGKMYSENAIECSDFIQLVDEWFSVFTSKSIKQENVQDPLPYGFDLQEQNAVIASMSDVIKSLRLNIDDTHLEPFQRGILLNNSSLPMFYQYLKRKHNIAYVITNNLNPDDIEHSFGIRKSYGGVACPPTPLEFKYRLRAGILVNFNIGLSA